MLRILFVFFVLVPLLELYVLIEVGSEIGGFTTIIICLLTAAVGGFMIRLQGLQTLLRIRESMATGQQHQLAEHGGHGVMLVIAGIFLFLPGLITDVLGFLLLMPPFRRIWIKRGDVAQRHHGKPQMSEVIEAEVIKED